MIIEELLNITDVTKGIVAHGCNCQGVMGSGAALDIKNTWPRVFFEYAKHCAPYVGTNSTHRLLGTVQYISVDHKAQLYVANVFTQNFYGRNGPHADLKSIVRGMTQVMGEAQRLNLSDVYMPKIGGGLGGLDWDTEVFPAIEGVHDMFTELTLHICDIFPPKEKVNV